MTVETQVVILIVSILVALIALFTLERNGAFTAAFEWGKAKLSFGADGRSIPPADEAAATTPAGDRFLENAKIEGDNRINIHKGDRVQYHGSPPPPPRPPSQGGDDDTG